MRRLVLAFAGRTYHIVWNLMSWLIYLLSPNLQNLSTSLDCINLEGINHLKTFYMTGPEYFCIPVDKTYWRFSQNGQIMFERKSHRDAVWNEWRTIQSKERMDETFKWADFPGNDL